MLLEQFAQNGEKTALLTTGQLGDKVTLVRGVVGDDMAIKHTEVVCDSQEASNTLAIAMTFSTNSIGVGVFHGHEIVSEPLSFEEKGNLHFACDLPKGTVTRITQSTREVQIESACEAARKATKQLLEHEPYKAIVFDCTCPQLIFFLGGGRLRICDSGNLAIPGQCSSGLSRLGLSQRFTRLELAMGFFNRLEALEAITVLPNLVELSLVNSALTDLSGMPFFPNFELLDLSATGLQDLRRRASLPALRTLVLRQNDDIVDTSGSWSMAVLETLDVSETDLRNLSVFGLEAEGLLPSFPGPPPEFGLEVAGLQTLNIGGNPQLIILDSLPKLPTITSLIVEKIPDLRTSTA